MLELNADNVVDYLRRQGLLGPGPARAWELKGGVSNVVLRVETPASALVVKQSRRRLRTRDDWFSAVERIWREQEVMEVLHAILPDVVPAVLFADRPNYFFAMAAAPADHAVWKQQLLAGEVDPAVAAAAGQILGRIHQATAEVPGVMDRFRDQTVFAELRIEPFYRRVQERRPEVAAAVEPLVDQLRTVKQALCHGDFTPKNLLVHGAGLTLVDYETAHLGDPAMDLGLFLAHLVLKSFRGAARRLAYLDLTRVFWKAYGQRASFAPPHELQARAVGHFGVCLLARIDGTSPVDYLGAEPTRAAVRQLARTVLGERPSTWEEVLALCEKEAPRA